MPCDAAPSLVRANFTSFADFARTVRELHSEALANLATGTRSRALASEENDTRTTPAALASSSLLRCVRCLPLQPENSLEMGTTITPHSRKLWRPRRVRHRMPAYPVANADINDARCLVAALPDIFRRALHLGPTESSLKPSSARAEPDQPVLASCQLRDAVADFDELLRGSKQFDRLTNNRFHMQEMLLAGRYPGCDPPPFRHPLAPTVMDEAVILEASS
eukprot:scaffold28_cov515-Prasinococcus_capsulatus_cf.AAC.16